MLLIMLKQANITQWLDTSITHAYMLYNLLIMDWAFFIVLRTCRAHLDLVIISNRYIYLYHSYSALLIIIKCQNILLLNHSLKPKDHAFVSILHFFLSFFNQQCYTKFQCKQTNFQVVNSFDIFFFSMGQAEIHSNQSHIEILHIAQEELESSMKVLPLRDVKKNVSLRFVSEEKIGDKVINIVFEQKQSGTSEFNTKYRVECNSYDYMSDQLLLQNEGMQIEKMLTDQLQCNKILYLTKERKAKSSIILRLYKQEKSNQHLQILREIYYYEKVKLLQCQSLHFLIKSYNIKSNPIISSQQVQVIVLEHINTTLQVLIKSRRSINKEWQIRQFMHLMTNLIEAVSYLHASGFAHNDIRPPNIYYSTNKQRFILGAFSKMTRFNENNHENSAQIPENMAQDVYMLGMTLLAAFYLVPFIDRKKCAPFNRMLISKYPILQIIKTMVCSPEKRSNIFEIQQKLKYYEKLYTLSQISSIRLLQNQKVKNDQQSTYRYKRLYSDFYKYMGLIDRWKQSMNDPIIHHRLSQQSIESASSFEQLALISELQGNQQNYKNYYKHSASIYLNIGKKHHYQRDYCSSIKMFEKGLSIMDKICYKADDIIYLGLQISLKESEIIFGERDIQLDEIRRIQQKILGLKMQDYFICWQFIESLVSIYRYLEKFDKISKLLNNFNQISDNIQAKIGPLKLKRMIALNNIQIASLLDEFDPTKIRLLKQTEQIIQKLFNHKQYYFIINPLQKMQIQYLIARLHFLAGKRKEAIQSIQQALLQHSQYSSFTQQSSNNLQNSIQHQLLRGSILQFKGDIWISLGEIQAGFNNYSLALKQYKDYFGDVYNIQSAIILQKIAYIQKQKGNHYQYINKIELSLKIIRTEYGLHHKNNRKLTSICRKIEDSLQYYTKQIISPFTLGRSRFDTQSNLSQFK